MQYFPLMKLGFSRQKAFSSVCKPIALDDETILIQLNSECEQKEIIITRRNSQFEVFCKLLEKIKDFRTEIVSDLDPEEYNFLTGQSSSSSNDDDDDDTEGEEEFYDDDNSSDSSDDEIHSNLGKIIGGMFSSKKSTNTNGSSSPLDEEQGGILNNGVLPASDDPVRSRKTFNPKIEFLEETNNVNSNHDINEPWVKIENTYIYEIFKHWKTLKLLDKNLIDLICKDSSATQGVPNEYLISSKVDSEKISSIKEWLNLNYASVFSYSCSVDEYVNQSSKLITTMNEIASSLTRLEVNPEILKEMEDTEYDPNNSIEIYKKLALEMKDQSVKITSQCNLIGNQMKRNLDSFNTVLNKIKTDFNELSRHKHEI